MANIEIGGRLHSTATGNVVAGANEIYDDAKGKKQSVVNQETDAALDDRYTKSQTYNKTELNNMITTPNQEFVTVTATDQTTDVTDVLPATGEADTVYRVGNWDGSQFDASVYSEYAWNGSQYVFLCVKSQIGEVFDISAYNNNAKYADLVAALNGGANIPQSLQKGGMSVKFVQSSDNKYVQYRLMAQSFTTDTTQWAIADEGIYVDNPEFIYLLLDSEYRIILGVKTNGDVVFGIGVPSQIKEYVETKFQEIFNEKVDKVEGKSLIDEDFANGIHYEENPEFLEVKIDKDERILEAIMADGTKLFPAGYKVGGNVVKTISNPEYLAAWLDSDNHILFALKVDGDVIFGCGIPSQIKEHVSELIEMFHYEDNSEFVDVKLDSEGKILEGIRNDGTKVLGSLNINGIAYFIVSNPEWLKAVVDSENKIICGIKADGTFCVVDIDFLDSSNKIKEVLNHFDALDNPEFLSVELDVNKKVLGGRKTDGTKFENVGLDLSGAVFKGIDDPEGRMEVKTDDTGKIISYRKSDGTLVENVGVEINHLELTKQGMSDFQQALKNSGFRPGGNGDWSDYISNDGELPLLLDKPSIMYINIHTDYDLTQLSKKGYSANPPKWPAGVEGVTYDIPTEVEVYTQSWHFKKWTLMSGQGNATMGHMKKNIALDFFDESVYDSKGKLGKGDAFKFRLGNWTPMDSYHLKANNESTFRLNNQLSYHIYNDIVKTRGIKDDYVWKRALIDFESIGISLMSNELAESAIDTGARCFPDGIPAIVFQNGNFWGIYFFSIKKDRSNYHMNKKTAENVHLDGIIDDDLMMANGNINWYIFTGKIPNWDNRTDGIEVRNPKDLYCMDGEKYDADVHNEELIDETSDYYDSTNKDHVKTKKVKKYIVDFSKAMTIINAAEDVYNASEKTAEDLATLKGVFETYFDVDNLVDYMIFGDLSYHWDGFRGKNWQWFTYDGVKWYCGLYDCDVTWGYRSFHGIQAPLEGHTCNVPAVHPEHNLLMNRYILTYYLEELESRYKELRDRGIIDAERICDIAQSYITAIGVNYFELEWEKWHEYFQAPDDSIYRLYNWLKQNISLKDSLYHYNV